MDDETHTYWDHITGEALHGPLAGKRLEPWGLEMTTVGAERLKTPPLLLYRSQPILKHRVMGWFMNLPFIQGWFPPGFRGTIDRVDPRLAEMCMGLGVVTDSTKRFYPKKYIGDGIDDTIDQRPIRITIGRDDEVPFAIFTDDRSRPLQLFSRWYGYSLTFPGCEVYREGS